MKIGSVCNSQGFMLGTVMILQLLLSHRLVWSFTPSLTTITSLAPSSQQQQAVLFMSEAPSDVADSPMSTTVSEESLQNLKGRLVKCCTQTNKPPLWEVQRLVQELEEMAEQVSAIKHLNCESLRNKNVLSKLFLTGVLPLFILFPTLCVPLNLHYRLVLVKHRPFLDS